MKSTAKKQLTIDDLNRLYSEGESCDKELFAEQRSNILLSSGNHFSQKSIGLRDRIRDVKSERDQKLRIVKNHTHTVCRTLVNNIVSLAPGVTPLPVDEKDLRHIKSAELNKAVWEFAKQRHQLTLKVQGWVKDFVEIGEVFCKVFFDPNAGTFVGYEQELDDMGNPMFDDFGQPVPSDRVSFSGDLLFKTILPANVIRAADAKTIEDSRFLCIRDMVDISELENMVGDDEDKLKAIHATEDKTFFVFDNKKGSYNQVNKQALVKEFFFRPCVEYPHGYFFITVETKILFEGELPYGIFPIAYAGYDEIVTTPRHRSIIKQLRPIQSEINRCASSLAQAQVVLGDDKVILQNGSKVTGGPQLPGIRTMFVTGQAPTIMPGRSGEQFMPYLQSAISELYQIANIALDSAEKAPNEPMLQAYATMRDKKKFSMYAEKFEGFLVSLCEKYLSLAKEYFDQNMLIPAIGRSEYINIDEFKNQDPLCVRVKVEPANDDMGKQLAKQLTLNHIMQYVGNNLSPDQIGKLIREMPFSNIENGFEDLTIDFDAATNILLALDRGEQVQAQPFDNAEYILKRLSARQKKQDYRLLGPQIQMNYQNLMQAYQNVLAQQAQQLKQAEAQFIPSGGAMVKVGFWIPDPTNKTRSIQATLPGEAIDWLIKQLTAQGSAQEQLQQLPQNVQAQVSSQVANQGMVPRQLQNPQALPPGPMAQHLSQFHN